MNSPEQNLSEWRAVGPAQRQSALNLIYAVPTGESFHCSTLTSQSICEELITTNTGGHVIQTAKDMKTEKRRWRSPPLQKYIN